MKTNFVLILICIFSICAGDKVNVKIKKGEIAGETDVSYGGRKFYKFRSIPFAQPPVGELRFEPPKSLKEWKGTLDVTAEAPSCMQYGQDNRAGEEDCLYLNVYTPYLKSESDAKSVPVVVWLHGGNFIVGTSADYKPTYLMDREIVLVVPQYRLGILGFYANNTIGTGNFGLQDQIAALKWVKRNIAQFGGNPEAVTLAGECAGAASALVHMSIPSSQGLFHGVMAFSGTPLNPWALRPVDTWMQTNLVSTGWCEEEDRSQNTDIECSRRVDAAKLMNSQALYSERTTGIINYGEMGITVQDDPAWFKGGKQPILPIHPMESWIKKNYTKVPVLLCVTKDVGSYLVDMKWPRFLNMPDYRIRDFLNGTLREAGIKDHPDVEEIKKYYVPQWRKKNVTEYLDDYSFLIGDIYYNAGILATAKMLSESVPTRVLRFEYMGGHKLNDARYPYKDTRPDMKQGVSMADELISFIPYTDSLKLTSDQEKVKELMLDIVDGFVNQSVNKKSWPLFEANSQQTRLVTREGNIVKKIKFFESKRENMLTKIFNYQFRNEISKFERETKDEGIKPSHTEL